MFFFGIVSGIDSITAQINGLLDSEEMKTAIEAINQNIEQTEEATTEETKDLIASQISVIVDTFVNFITTFAGSIIRLVVNVAMFSIFFVVLLPNLINIRDAAIRVLPFREKLTEMYIRRAGVIIKDTVYASFVISFIQAVIWFFTFTLLGVENAGFLTVIVFILGFIPLIGAAVVTIPLGIIFILNGDILNAVILWGVHFLVISNVEIFVRPYVVSEEAKMPPILIILSVVGGLSAWGFLGLFYGPVIMISFKTSLEIIIENYKKGSLLLKDEYMEDVIKEKVEEIVYAEDSKPSKKSAKKKVGKKK